MNVGVHSYGFEGITFAPADEDLVHVGNFCSCAQGVRFIVSGYHHTSVATFPFHTIFGVEDRRDRAIKGPITIEHDSWLCSNAIILSGVTIGIGSIVGAGAVVHDSCLPYSLIAGNPARLIRRRFPQETITKLLQIAWWDWPEEKVTEFADDFYGSVDDFLVKHG